MPYPEVNLVLDELLVSVQTILGEHLIGMYLYGSLTTGGFDRDSDVDYVVVTDEEVSDDQFAALEAMHTRIKTKDVWCVDQLEGSYIPLAGLNRYHSARALFIHIDRGPDEHLHRMHIDDERISRAWWGGWILLRHALREHGITLIGPEIKTLLDPVSSDDLRQAALFVLNGWAADILNDPNQIRSRGYQSYTVLTLCRILYTLHTGGITSKPDAIRWAKENLGEKWMPLIDRAWLGRQNPGLDADINDLNETVELIRFTIEQSQQIELEKKAK